MISLIRLSKSFGYALKGLYKVFREEQNVRIQTMAALAVLTASVILGISLGELCLLIIVISSVILMEIINSAVERIADILKPRIDNYIKEIKDITAAAVMMASLAALVVGAIILFPHLLGVK